MCIRDSCWCVSFLGKCSSANGSFGDPLLPKARDPGGNRLAGDRRERFVRGREYGLGAAEGGVKSLHARGSKAADREQRTLEGVLAARPPVRLEAEAMRLVARPLEQLETGVRPWEDDRRGASRHEHLLLALRERGRRHVDSDSVERPEGRRELPFAAVDQEKVGQRSPLVLRARIPARDGLGDRGEVVDRRPLDAEEAVLVLRGLTVHELSL